MSTLESQMQLVAYVAAEIEEATLNISDVEDTGKTVVFHLTGVTDEQMTRAVPHFERIERELQFRKDAYATDVDVQIRLVRASKEVEPQI